MSTADLPFDPSLPYPLALPWPVPWNFTVVYDVYKALAYIDEQGAYMAESRRARRALMDQSAAIDAMKDGPDKQDANYEWNRAYTAWQRADAIRQLQYFVLRCEFPNGRDVPGRDPALWARVPTTLLLWLANEGYAQAVKAVWAEPDPKAPAPSPSPTPSMPVSTADGSTPA